MGSSQQGQTPPTPTARMNRLHSSAELLVERARIAVIARIDGDRATLTAGRQRSRWALAVMTLPPRHGPARCRAPKLVTDRGEVAATPLAGRNAVVTRRDLGYPVLTAPARHDRRPRHATTIHSSAEFSTPSPRAPLPSVYYYYSLTFRSRMPPLAWVRTFPQAGCR